MTAPTELPETLEIANSRLRKSAVPSSRYFPITLAVKKPARLAPPEAATIKGRGQDAASPSQPLARFQSCTAS